MDGGEEFVVTGPLEAHPAAEIMPLMSAAQFLDFKRSIHEHGLNHPIVLHEGKILDGRNRYKACTELGVEVRAVAWKMDRSPLDYVLQENMDRRQLTESQRGMVAAKATELRAKLEAEARGRQRESGGDRGNQYVKKVAVSHHGVKAAQDDPAKEPPPRVHALKELGKQFGVSGETVRRSQIVLKDGTPEEVAAVERGTMSVRAAVRQIRGCKEPKRGEAELESVAQEKVAPNFGTIANQMAVLAIDQLKRIPKADPKKQAAFDRVAAWIEKERKVSC